MSARLTVSTIIPTHNRAHLIERALRSVIPQCEPGDEVIVVDDGSTDGTPELIERYGPPVRLLRTPHAGAGAARNAGIRAAGGDLVAFLDSDDEWMPGKLASQRAIMEQLPDVLFVFSDFGFISAASGKREPHRLTYWRSLWAPDLLSWTEILGPPISSSTIPGLAPTTPPFSLYVGSLYPHYMNHWVVSTIVIMVRRVAAGEALRFAEDLPLFEDLECFGRLTARGKAAFMDCDTAWNHGHGEPRLTAADELTKARTAVTVLGRVWGSDATYLSRHQHAFEVAADAHLLRAVRSLLVMGRVAEARQELERMNHPPVLERLLSRLPPPLVLAGLAARRALRVARP